jgi:outer membrane immunogenic protein
VATNNNRWISTVAARFGYAFFDHLLLYGKVGGGCVGNNNLTVTNVTTGASLTCGNFTNCGNNVGGWLVGAGGEYAFAPNWSVKFEYDFLGLGSRTFVIPATAPFLAGDVFTSNRNIQEFKVGVNYLFNWGAPVAARLPSDVVDCRRPEPRRTRARESPLLADSVAKVLLRHGT